MKTRIKKKVRELGARTGLQTSGVVKAIDYLTVPEVLRFDALLNGYRRFEHVQSMAKVSTSFVKHEEKISSVRLYLSFQAVLWKMQDWYDHNSSPADIMHWIQYCGISTTASLQEQHRYAAVLEALSGLHHNREYSSITHTTDLNKVGILKWAFDNPESVQDVLDTRAAMGTKLVSPGMVKYFLGKQDATDNGVPADAWEARTFIYAAINGGANGDETVALLSQLSDEEAVSVYRNLTGTYGKSSHKTLCDIFSNDYKIDEYLKAYAVAGEVLHSLEIGSSDDYPYEQIKWLIFNGISPDDAAGFKAAAEVSMRINIPWASRPSTLISALHRLGILQTAYARHDDVEKLIGIYDDDPNRPHFSVELLDAHGALTDGVL